MAITGCSDGNVLTIKREKTMSMWEKTKRD